MSSIIRNGNSNNKERLLLVQSAEDVVAGDDVVGVVVEASSNLKDKRRMEPEDTKPVIDELKETEVVLPYTGLKREQIRRK